MNQMQQQNEPNQQNQQYNMPQYMPRESVQEKVMRLLPKISFIFLVMAGVAFLYYFISAIVGASRAYSSELETFLREFGNGIYRGSIYLFFSISCSFFNSVLKRK